MLIATLPSALQMARINEIVNHPLVAEVRYNVGARNPYGPTETLERLDRLCQVTKKPLWVDLKGRQLRITQWADSAYGDIVLSHSIKALELPARVVFRGGGESQIVAFEGNRIFVDPDPDDALGAGQAINILGEGLEIDGYLTERDEAYIEAAKKLGISRLMLSYVEGEQDIAEALALYPEAQLGLKIESRKGLEFVRGYETVSHPNCQLILARDDLTTELGSGQATILKATEMVIDRDPMAIAASHIFGSLARGAISPSDWSDLRWLWWLRYENYMLDDVVCKHYFVPAMKAWKAFMEAMAV